MAIQSFARAYRESRATVPPGVVIGPEAAEALAATLREGKLGEQGLEHLRGFALPLGVRRALDYAWFLREVDAKLADLKSRQARRLGRAPRRPQPRGDRELLADHLIQLAGLECEFEAALSASHPDGP